MGSLENSLRRKWQDYSGNAAKGAEHSFYEVFEQLFDKTPLTLVRQPKKFERIYVDVVLDANEMNEIYVPAIAIDQHGIRPDCLIRNEETGKEIYVEIKRQDGWVENKTRHDGRGNAHERLCKYFTPGLLRILQHSSGISPYHLPFWIVFEGDITRDICHVREIRLWFDVHQGNVTFWRDTQDSRPLVEHFLNNILPLLEN